MGEWTEQHERLVAEARPQTGPVNTDLDRAWACISENIAEPRAKRSRRTMVAGAAGALVLAVAGTAAASVLSSHTGVYQKDHESQVLGGPGEQLDPRGEDLREVIAEATADIPFPAGTARQISLDFQVIDLRPDPGDTEPTRTSTGAVRGWVANDAICSWSNEWVRASTAEDLVDKQRATAALGAASRWPIVVTLQSLDSDRFKWLPRIQRAALGTSTSALENALIPTVFCARALVPDMADASAKVMPPCSPSSMTAKQRAATCPRSMWGPDR